MLNPITEIIDTVKALTAGPGARIAAAQVQAEADRARAEAAAEAYANALADLAEGTGDDAKVAKLKRERDAAKDTALDSSETLLALQARQRAATVASKRNADAQQWDKAVALVDARQAAFEHLGKQAKAFAESWREVLRLNGELYGVLPAKPDMDAAVLNVPQIETAVRRELLRLGVDWATSYPWGRETLPPMMDAFNGAPSVVRNWSEGRNHG
jgi:SAM-dependent methyltransferase